MRLINVHTLELEPPRYGDLPPYAILSHTWEGEEVTMQEFTSATDGVKAKTGYKKIAQTCALARKEGYDHVWVDTCCIDKTSSAELSEAINSMYNWYFGSAICYAYLSDLEPDPGHGASSTSPTTISDNVRVEQLRTCRWFTRGWTLQELIAPFTVHFLDQGWNFRGAKSSLIDILHEITGIQTMVLEYSKYKHRLPIVARMSWAANRETTRIEDMAYCLMGIFDVNMPLLYGERGKAFVRLQHEIIRLIPDLSVFGWGMPKELVLGVDDVTAEAGAERDLKDALPLLAFDPIHFRFPVTPSRPWVATNSIEYSLTNIGIRITCSLLQICLDHHKSSHVFGTDPRADSKTGKCVVNCNYRAYLLETSNNTATLINHQPRGNEWGIVLRKTGPDMFVRAYHSVVWIGRMRRADPVYSSARTIKRPIYLASDLDHVTRGHKPSFETVIAERWALFRIVLHGANVRFRTAFPESRWDFVQLAFFLDAVPSDERWGMVSVQVSRATQSELTGEASAVKRYSSLRSSNNSGVDEQSLMRPSRVCIFFNHTMGRLWILDEVLAQSAISNIRRCGAEWKSVDVESCLRDADLVKTERAWVSGSAVHRRDEGGGGGAYVTETIAGSEIRAEMVTNKDGFWSELRLSCEEA